VWTLRGPGVSRACIRTANLVKIGTSDIVRNNEKKRLVSVKGMGWSVMRLWRRLKAQGSRQEAKG